VDRTSEGDHAVFDVDLESPALDIRIASEFEADEIANRVVGNRLVGSQADACQEQNGHKRGNYSKHRLLRPLYARRAHPETWISRATRAARAHAGRERSSRRRAAPSRGAPRCRCA